MRKIVADVAILDKKFAPLIKRRPLCTLGRTVSDETHFQSLVSSVISQQLASLAQRPALQRGWDLIHKNKAKIPVKILELKGEKLRPHRSVAAWYCYQAVHETRGLAF